MIRFVCPKCKAVIQAPDSNVGSKAPCLSCDQRLQVPARPPTKTLLGGALPTKQPPDGKTVAGDLLLEEAQPPPAAEPSVVPIRHRNLQVPSTFARLYDDTAPWNRFLTTRILPSREKLESKDRKQHLFEPEISMIRLTCRCAAFARAMRWTSLVACVAFLFVLGTGTALPQVENDKPGGLGNRAKASREKVLKEEGGTRLSEGAVTRGLSWIARHQAEDGHWGMHDFHVHGKCKCANQGEKNDVVGTALGLLPLLAAGETHQGVGKEQMYAKNVERGLKWLLTRQGADGSFNGGTYEHAIATLALCEAYGMTLDKELKVPAQRAINSAAIPGNTFDPVWCWLVQALKTGELAGLDVPKEKLARCNKFLDSVSNADGSAYGYQKPGPTPNTTAMGLLSRQWLGWDGKKPGLQSGVAYLRKQSPADNFKNMQYYCFATQVMHHIAPINSEAWEQWNPKMRDLLVEKQDAGLNPDRKDQKGSWSPQGDPAEGQLGRLGYTSLAVLTLEVYYRHVPLYRGKDNMK